MRRIITWGLVLLGIGVVTGFLVRLLWPRRDH
jgi:hypothetical protein